MMRKVFVMVALAAVVLLSSGCAKLVLKHNALPAPAKSLTAVTVKVNDARAEDRGLGNENQVGQLRNMYGMRFAFEAENSMIAEMEAITKDALTSAGYQVTDNAPVTVVVDVVDFWMDGYMGYKMDTKFKVVVNSGGAATYTQEFAQSEGFGHTSNKKLYEGFDRLMNKLAARAVEVFSTPEFQAAVAGEAVAAAPAAPAAPLAADATEAPAAE